MKNTTNADTSTLYLDIHLKIDSERRLRTKLYDIRDDFNFPLRTFHLYVATPAHGVYISQLTLYSTDCVSYQDFTDRFPLVKLKSSLRTFHGRHHELVDRYGKYVSQMIMDMFHLSSTLPDPFFIHDLAPDL
jgi:hypothetical protein